MVGRGSARNIGLAVQRHDRTRDRQVVVVALDGRSGAGKSTLARVVAEQLNAALVLGDDFYRVMDERERWKLAAASGAARYFDWERLREVALLPLREGRDAKYRAYAWEAGGGFTDALVHVPSRPAVVLDGVYAARPELADLVDLTVLVSTSAEVRAHRLATRGHGNERWHSRWDGAESIYFSQIRPAESFDIVVAGE